MIIEFLTFDIDPAERSEWLEVEQGTWSAALREHDGFVRKEIWASEDDPRAVHAVIWWSDQESWDGVGADEVAAVDASMGRWFREPQMRSFQLLREG